MIPSGTTYRLAEGPDFAVCHKLFKSQGHERDARYAFPTVVADRDGDIVGFYSTNDAQEYITAGPLEVDKSLDNPLIVAIRLVDAYDNVMRSVGINSYLFSVDKDNEQWKDIMERATGLESYAEDETRYWYRKEL
jgi:hypothetical protein